MNNTPPPLPVNPNPPQQQPVQYVQQVQPQTQGIVITKTHVYIAGFVLGVVWLMFFAQRASVIIDTGVTPSDPIELGKYLAGIGDSAEQFRMKANFYNAFK